MRFPVARGQLLGLTIVAILVTLSGCDKEKPKKKEDPKSLSKKDWDKRRRSREQLRDEVRRLIDATQYEQAIAKADEYLQTYKRAEKGYDKRDEAALVHNYRGFSLERTGKHAEALAAYREAHGLDTSNKIYLANIAKMCARRGDLQCSLEMIKKMRKVDPSGAKTVTHIVSSPDMEFYLPADQTAKKNQLLHEAVPKIKAQDLDGAANLLKEALAQDPNYVPTLINYGLYHGWKAEWQDAVMYLKRATTKAGTQPAGTPAPPEIVALNMAKAVVFHRQGNMYEATKWYQAVLAAKPDHKTALYGLGAAQMNSGQKNQALDTYNKLKELSPPLAKKLFAIIMAE